MPATLWEELMQHTFAPPFEHYQLDAAYDEMFDIVPRVGTTHCRTQCNKQNVEKGRAAGIAGTRICKRIEGGHERNFSWDMESNFEVYIHECWFKTSCSMPQSLDIPNAYALCLNAGRMHHIWYASHMELHDVNDHSDSHHVPITDVAAYPF